MKVLSLIIVAVFMFSIGIAVDVSADEQKVCPVSGKQVDGSHFAEVDGKKVHVCCDNCKKKIEAEPAKYIGKLEQADATLAKATTDQTVCPVSGKKIDMSKYVDHEGKRIYVCCDGCVKKVKADPSGYINKLEEQGITLAKATVPQTKCPVMGSDIDRTKYVDVNGKRIYVCCDHCIDTIKEDPSAYIEKLEKDGVELESVSTD